MHPTMFVLYVFNREKIAVCIIHAGRSERRATEAVDGWHDIAWKQFVLSAVITRRDNSMLNTAIHLLEHFPIMTFVTENFK